MATSSSILTPHREQKGPLLCTHVCLVTSCLVWTLGPAWTVQVEWVECGLDQCQVAEVWKHANINLHAFPFNIIMYWYSLPMMQQSVIISLSPMEWSAIVHLLPPDWRVLWLHTAVMRGTDCLLAWELEHVSLTRHGVEKTSFAKVCNNYYAQNQI